MKLTLAILFAAMLMIAGCGQTSPMTSPSRSATGAHVAAVTAGAVLELQAVGADGGVAPGGNAPRTLSWADTSGRGHTGTVTGVAGTTSSGWAGQRALADPYRLVLDNVDDYVSLPCLHVTEDTVFTLEAWFVSPTTPPSPEPPANAYDFILTEAGPMVTTYPEVGLCIYAPSGPTPPGLARFFYRDQDGGEALIYGPSSVDLCDGHIHHMLAVSDGVNGTLYVDDVAGTPVAVPAGKITMSWASFGAQSVGGPFHNLDGALIVGRM